jgi:small subunit ribosomal protein S8e
MVTKKGKKISGGRYKKRRKKKSYELHSKPLDLVIGKEKKKKIRIRNGKIKTILLRTNKINIINQKTHKTRIVEMKNVSEVPSNIFLARKNILVKGAIVDTEIGKAKITNRPKKEGFVQGILLKKED